MITTGDWFERFVSAIEMLHRANARHRKGRTLQDMAADGASMLLHAQSEIVEIWEAEKIEHAEQEMGDALSILVHFALVHKMKLADVFKRWLMKIRTDFPDQPPLEFVDTGDRLDEILDVQPLPKEGTNQ